MFQFTGLPSHELCIHSWIHTHYCMGVSPFGNLRVIGCLHLTAAYRSLPRPSSAPIAKASTLCSLFLNLLLVFFPSFCVSLSLLSRHIPQYAPRSSLRLPCLTKKILRNSFEILFKIQLFTFVKRHWSFSLEIVVNYLRLFSFEITYANWYN